MPISNVIIAIAFWIALGIFFWLRKRSEQKRIQRRRDRFTRLRLNSGWSTVNEIRKETSQEKHIL